MVAVGRIKDALSLCQFESNLENLKKKSWQPTKVTPLKTPLESKGKHRAQNICAFSMHEIHDQRLSVVGLKMNSVNRFSILLVAFEII